MAADDAGDEDEVLSEEQYVRLREMLDAADADGDGRLSIREVTKREKELSAIMAALGMPGRPQEAFKRLDKNRDGYVTAAELLVTMLPHLPRRLVERDVQRHEAAYVAAGGGARQYSDGDDGGGGDGDDGGGGAEEGLLDRDLYWEFRTIFAEMDEDGSGFISSTELMRSDCNVLSRLVNLFGSRGRGGTPTLAAFKQIDKDRDGRVAPVELLRHLLPDAPAHRVKAAARPLEKEWVAENPPPPRAEVRRGRPSDAEEWGEGEEEGGSEPQVISAEEFEWHRDIFEQMDVDHSGEVTMTELKAFLDSNPSPFAAKIDWKALDIDHSGYISFEELLRRCHPKARAFQVRRDIKILAETVGLPEGCELADDGRVLGRNAAAASVERRRRREGGGRGGGSGGGGGRRGRRRSSPRGLPGLRSIPATTPTPQHRGAWHDRRIRDLEERLRAITQEAAERGAKYVKLRSPPRQCLTEEQVYASNRRLYTDEVLRRQDNMNTLWRRVRLEQSPPGKARWLCAGRLDDAEGSYDRLFRGEGVNDMIHAAKEARNEALEKIALVARRTIDKERMAERCDHLARGDVKDREAKRQALDKKWAAPPLAKRATTGADATACTQRLFDGAKEGKERHEARREKFVSENVSLPKVRLTKEQQAAMIGRMTPQ